jgi:hypothetical protein
LAVLQDLPEWTEWPEWTGADRAFLRPRWKAQGTRPETPPSLGAKALAKKPSLGRVPASSRFAWPDFPLPLPIRPFPHRSCVPLRTSFIFCWRHLVPIRDMPARDYLARQAVLTSSSCEVRRGCRTVWPSGAPFSCCPDGQDRDGIPHRVPVPGVPCLPCTDSTARSISRSTLEKASRMPNGIKTEINM